MCSLKYVFFKILHTKCLPVVFCRVSMFLLQVFHMFYRHFNNFGFFNSSSSLLEVFCWYKSRQICKAIVHSISSPFLNYTVWHRILLVKKNISIATTKQFFVKSISSLRIRKAWIIYILCNNDFRIRQQLFGKLLKSEITYFWKNQLSGIYFNTINNARYSMRMNNAGQLENNCFQSSWNNIYF